MQRFDVFFIFPDRKKFQGTSKDIIVFVNGIGMLQMTQMVNISTEHSIKRPDSESKAKREIPSTAQFALRAAANNRIISFSTCQHILLLRPDNDRNVTFCLSPLSLSR